MSKKLIKKYNIPCPRYTSYPTVPYWDTLPPKEEDWRLRVSENFNKSNLSEGISIYIHLPFCESLCTYCGCTTRITKNHFVEEPYIEALLKEWGMYLQLLKRRPHIKELHLGGGTPTFFSAANLRRLIEGITANAVICDKADFSIEGHPNNTTFEQLTELYVLGFRRLSLGIQDFDPKVQEAIHRIQPFETVENITALARAIGYTSINFDLIYGLPFQTRKSIIETVNKVKLLRPDRIALYSYAHVPWIKPAQRKFTEKDLPLEVEKRALYEIGRAKFKEEGYKEIGMDHFALASDLLFKAVNQKTLHRNFMGYTAGKTSLLIGLGVSSISDCWNGFIQNVKTVEAYYKKLDENKLPFFRGHLLSAEDLALRHHILNIMCHGATSWQAKEYQCQALYEALERLIDLEEDGLVILLNDGLKVTKKGEPFLRNICMAFDARLWRAVPGSNLFSSSI